MPNKNYLRGVRFERELLNRAKDIGAKVVMRASGSHGKYDLMFLYPNKTLDLIQCKTKLVDILPPDSDEIVSDEEAFGTIVVTGYKVTKYIKRRK